MTSIRKEDMGTYDSRSLGEGNFEIGQILHLKPEIRNRKLDRGVGCPSNLRFRISGFEMQDSSNFEISLSALRARYIAGIGASTPPHRFIVFSSSRPQALRYRNNCVRYAACPPITMFTK